ncbi:hypothetical protein EXE58_07790 [Nocardioides seonyuensis]|uniref:Lipoprotein n=1 Tax=Nocardioides seonyuensis TaxID=2518371 RepID=A0A4P7IDT7_9ACTN|nr:hypothetical protein [Nocardioides seonyuensis]QBX55364.1 hypothetical protein EXE58_07790 [Nocardioides seonyuensis]
MSRRHLALPLVGVLLAATAVACGGSDDAPTNASDKDFCEGQSSLMQDLATSAQKTPEPTELAELIQDWADEVEEIGTPDDIPEDARAGFETTLEQARDISAEDLEQDNLDKLGEDLSGEAEKQAEAFNRYVGETCGDVFGDLDLPEVPELSENP